MALKQLVSNSARRASALLVVVSVIAASLVGLSLRASRADATPSEYFPAITVAGSPEGTDGTDASHLWVPNGMTLDADGNMYIADSANNRIQKWAPNATVGITVAGGSVYGADANQLGNPQGVAVDSDGNIYIADMPNNRIQKWAPNATVGVTVAGGNGQGGEANQLNNPYSVALDADGNIFIADTYNNRIQKWAAGCANECSGVTVAGGSSGSEADQLKLPLGVSVEANGDIYIADTDNNRIQKWVLGATTGTRVAGGNGGDYATGADQLSFPRAVEVDADGNLYIADFGNNRIQKWAPGATTGETLAGGGAYGSGADQLAYPSDVAIDANGDIYIVDMNNNRIQELVRRVTTVAGGNGGGANANQLRTPLGVAVDGDGNLYVADNENHRVQKFAPGCTSACTGVTVAGGNGNSDGANQLNSPVGVTVDADGNIYIADTANDRIQKWAPGATEGTTVAGGNGKSNGANQLNSPHGVAVDTAGNIYIADTANNRIQKWAPNASVGMTVAGGDVYGTNADQLNSPHGVAVDETGNIYIADSSNNRIQKWGPGDTEGITVAGGNAGSNADQLSYPHGVVADTAGNIYIADTNNHRIQKWGLGDSQGTTVAGGNGQGLTANQFAYPYGVAVDMSGNIYITDTINHRIQKWAFLPQSIEFDSLPERARTAPELTLAATASSGLPMTFSSTTQSVCTVIGTEVSMTGLTGECTIQATQTGSNLYAPAAAYQSFAVKDVQSITFGALTDRFNTASAFPISGSSSSGLTVAFSSTTTSVCSVDTTSVALVTLTGEIGTCTIRATEAGNSTYLPADPVQQSFEVTARAMILRVGDISLGEGSDSATTVQALVSASAPFASPVCVWWHTADVTATSVDKPILFNGLQDYMRTGISKKKFSIIATNKTLAKLSVKVNYDQVTEADETFQIIVDKVTTQTAGKCTWDQNAPTDSRIKVSRSTGTVTIFDDDTPE